ncbi:MAG TPA: uracil-DNA glycosylase family protein, partial [Chloroflexia bacterium]|nr:uracil-DNA glycosylase family protein [Chloroflexia bacterium]
MGKLDKLNQQVRSCRLCRLCRTRLNGVPGDGSENAEVLFIGEGPGYNEDQEGRPFVGAAGKFLNELLEVAG